MKLVVQRVTTASVTVSGELISEIGPGLLVLLGITHDDTAVDWHVNKVLDLRIFHDEEGKMNRSLLDVGGELLVVSQFTLYGNCEKGRRPSFIEAARPEVAEPLYEAFLARARERLGDRVKAGVFGAEMQVSLLNDGPVTLII